MIDGAFIFAVAVFVSIGGHRLVMAGLLDTFATMPPGTAVLSGSISDAMCAKRSRGTRGL